MPARRRALTALMGHALSGGVLLLQVPLAQGAGVLAVRVWPARDYTRVTLELDAPLQFSHQLVTEPHRLVVDLQGVNLDSAMRDLVSKVRSDDPWIAGVRAGQYRPGVMRIVFDLRDVVRPRLFELEPAGPYRYRLVIDLLPVAEPDALALLLGQIDDPLESLIASRSAPSGAPSWRQLPSGPPDGPAQSGGGRNAEPPASEGRSAGAVPSNRAQQEALSRREATLRRFTIALDPGHGGEDPGAIGPAGTYEKDVVLAIARKVRQRLREVPEIQVYMTRDADFFVPLSQRVARARAVSADLFVSIHADAFVQPQARGASVFVLSDSSASSMGARWLASRENRADLVGGAAPASANQEAARILIDMSRTAQISQSRHLGTVMLSELRQVGALHKAAVEQAGFAVLRSPDMPSVLVETAFISNPEEERKLRDPVEQGRIADALARGIVAYVRRLALRGRT
ncbi:MAG: N-acetylmuramoyl-L-alanine amidase [Burkholderiaceae bacterium]